MEETPKPVSVPIDVQLYAELKRISENEGLRINWMVNKAIAEWLERRKQR